MPSHLIETYPAHILRPVTSSDLWKRLIRSVTPLDDFEHARENIVDLYAEVCSEIEEVEEAFSDKSDSQLQEWAIEPYFRIPEYDPHETATTLLSFPAKLAGLIKQLSTVIAVGGSLLSVKRLHAIGMDGLRVIDAIEGVVPLSFIALSIVYLWFLHADTLAHQTFGEELRAGPGRVKTRRRSKIIGYGIWNRSLLGQSGLVLVGFFFFLDALSKLPIVERWFDDPVGFVVNLITENAESLYEADGTIEAGRILFRQLK